MRVRLLREGARVPRPMTDQAAGVDLHACTDPGGCVLPVSIAPAARVLIGTGVAIELPPGMEGQVRPRSGLALRHGVTVLNSPGTIDADYRGELMVLLINHGADPFAVADGDRIAQLVVSGIVRVRFVVTDALGDTSRGAGGYGHTGKV